MRDSKEKLTKAVMLLIIAILLYVIRIEIFNYAKYTYNSTYIDNNNTNNNNYEDIKNSKDNKTLDKLTYKKLLTNANIYVNNSNKLNGNVDTDVIIIDDDTFIDGKNNNKYIDEDNNTFEYVDCIYTYNSVIVRYINELGSIKMIASMFKDNKYSIYNVNDISKYENIDETDNVITNIINIIINISNNKEDPKILNEYFVLSDVGESLQIIENKTECKISYAVAGMSDLSIDYMDRIFIQIQENDKYTNIILKLNTDGKIFDMDII